MVAPTAGSVVAVVTGAVASTSSVRSLVAVSLTVTTTLATRVGSSIPVSIMPTRVKSWPFRVARS